MCSHVLYWNFLFPLQALKLEGVADRSVQDLMRAAMVLMAQLERELEEVGEAMREKVRIFL